MILRERLKTNKGKKGVQPLLVAGAGKYDFVWQATQGLAGAGRGRGEAGRGTAEAGRAILKAYANGTG